MTNTPSTKPAGTIKTTWELRTYDVWGNAKDGYQVNDSFRSGEFELRIPVTRYNVGVTDPQTGASREFKAASPTDKQIKNVLGVRCHIETDGDDLHIEVERRRDGFPLGSLVCTSHSSLSPIKPINQEEK